MVLAEWWEPIVGLALVIATIGLVVMTYYLAYHAKKLWQGAKVIADRERELKLLPQLQVFTIKLIEDKRCRITLKNVGFGYAMNLEAYEILSDLTRSPLMPIDQKEFVEVGDIFNWDIPDSTLSQQKIIEIRYTDILKEHPHVYTRPITVI